MTVCKYYIVILVIVMTFFYNLDNAKFITNFNVSRIWLVSLFFVWYRDSDEDINKWTFKFNDISICMIYVVKFVVFLTSFLFIYYIFDVTNHVYCHINL